MASYSVPQSGEYSEDPGKGTTNLAEVRGWSLSFLLLTAPSPLKVSDSDFSLLERALLTLYDDQIIPAAFNLRGRLREFGCSSMVKNNFVSVFLRQVE